MKKIKTTLFILIVFWNHLFGQDGQPSDLLKKYNVKSVEAYVFKEKDKPDSTLITVEQFNQQGKRTKIQIIDSLGAKATYEYFYEMDTIKTERRTYNRDRLSSVTKVYNNKDGKELQCVDFDEKGQRTGAGSANKYNKRGQLVESTIHFHARLAVYRKYKYYKNGNKKEVKVLLPKNSAGKIKYDKNGKQLKSKKSSSIKEEEYFENYNGTIGKMTKTTITYNRDTKILGIAGWLDLKQKDILVTEHYYTVNGLLNYEIQYLNGNFTARKSYKYIQY